MLPSASLLLSVKEQTNAAQLTPKFAFGGVLTGGATTSLPLPPQAASQTIPATGTHPELRIHDSLARIGHTWPPRTQCPWPHRRAARDGGNIVAGHGFRRDASHVGSRSDRCPRLG